MAAEKNAVRGAPSAIESQLYLGPSLFSSTTGRDKTELLAAIHATAIVNCTPEEEFPPSGFAEASLLRVPVPDEHDADIGQHFHSTTTFIRDQLAAGGVVYVHCETGASRSVSVVLHFLMSERGLTLKAAHDLVVGQRWCAWPNEGFWAQLVAAEGELAREAGEAGEVEAHGAGAGDEGASWSSSYPLAEYQAVSIANDLADFGWTVDDARAALEVAGGDARRAREHFNQQIIEGNAPSFG